MRVLKIGGIYPQICLELGEDLEDFPEFGVRLECVTHGSEVVGTLIRVSTNHGV